jgi:integrase
MSLTKRTWYSKSPTGQRVKRLAYGFTLQVGDKQVRKSDASWTKEEAEKAEAEYRLGIGLDQPTNRGSPTFGAAIERFLQAKGRKRSVEADKRHLELLKRAFGAGTPLAQITSARISAWKEQRLTERCPSTKRFYSAASVNRPLATLRHLLRLAKEEWEVIERVPRIRLEKEPEGRVRYLGQYSRDEEARLLRACKESVNLELPTIVLLLLHTGGRRSEVLNLTWENDIDFAQGYVIFNQTKNGRRRSVPMTQTVYLALAALPGPHEGKVFRTRSIRTAFERAVERAKLEDFHLHDCRHTFASRLVMAGVGLQAVKELLGHSSLAMTMRYAHLSPAHLREAIAKLDAPASVDVLPAAALAPRIPEFSTKSAQSVSAAVASESGCSRSS